MYIIVLFGPVILVQSCSKGSSPGGNNPPSPPAGKSLAVYLDKSTIGADGWETVTITVKDQDNNDVTSSSFLYLGNVGLPGNTFYTSTPGSYTIKAVRSGISSPEVSLTATNPGPSPFSQKVIVEDYTGTWCGHCPRVGIKLEEYVNTNPDAIVIANHGPSNDPFTFSNHASLAGVFNVSGYPSVWVDRDFQWNESAVQLDGEFNNRRAPLGISFQTTVDGTNISGTAKVKFDVTTAVSLKLVLYLVEDGRVYPQVNYNYYGLPNPISDYVHNGILRLTLTDLYGDDISPSSQVKGNTFEKEFAVNAAGYDISKCRIVGFVVQGPNNQSRKEKVVLNARSVQAGSNLDFD